MRRTEKRPEKKTETDGPGRIASPSLAHLHSVLYRIVSYRIEALEIRHASVLLTFAAMPCHKLTERPEHESPAH